MSPQWDFKLCEDEYHLLSFCGILWYSENLNILNEYKAHRVIITLFPQNVTNMNNIIYTWFLTSPPSNMNCTKIPVFVGYSFEIIPKSGYQNSNNNNNNNDNNIIKKQYRKQESQ